MRLADKVAIVTGGGTGIGAAIATTFAREGARVTITGRRKEILDEVADEIAAAGGHALAVPGSVTDEADVQRAVQATLATFGRVDVLVNNAGSLLHAGPLHETADEIWDGVMDVFLKGVFRFSRAVIPHMERQGGGSIVNIGSVLGLKASLAFPVHPGDALGASVHCANSVDVHGSTRDVGEQFRRVEASERLLGDEQRLPDHRRRVLNLLEPLGRRRPQPHRREGRLHRVRRPQMLPVLARELVERHHPLPVAIERARGLGMAALRAPRLERSLLPRGLLSGLGVRNSREQTPRFGLLLERQLVEEVQEAVIPASLLLRLREDGSQRAPDAEMPIADDHLRRRKSAPLEIAQDR